VILRLIAINSLGWLVVQLSIAAIFVRLPDGFFAALSCLDRIYPLEIKLYLKVLNIRRWKHRLPDGASWMGGAPPAKPLVGRDPARLRRFVIATRRSELAHWAMFACCPLFFLWNPPSAWPILSLYATVANFPCIAAQRYNRHAAQRILDHVNP
jgi:glycosyl-4,4'-diaponeurosporenoate acyltransferase